MDIDTMFKAPALIIGGLGSSLGLYLGDSKPKTKLGYVGYVLAGALTTNFLTPLVIALLPYLGGDVEPATGFVVGLLGISLLSIVYNSIKKITSELRRDFWGTLEKGKEFFKDENKEEDKDA